ERLAAAAAEAVHSIPFKECAERYIADHRASWKNAKHSAQWDATLEAYAYPIIGAIAVRGIDTAAVMKVLEQQLPNKGEPAPLWRLRQETASRLRGRIEQILDWASARGFRGGDNPARWRGHINKLLPSRSKIKKRKHHTALPYVEVGDFMLEL